MEKFVQLHIHNSMGSLLDGVASPEDYAKRASEYGHEALAVTDHGRLIALYNHQQSCLKYGIKPIFGMEAYLTDELVHEEDGKRKRTHANHLILLVKNEKGYKNLLKLNYISNKDTNHFYYVPRITEDELFENGEGLIIGSACLASKFSMLIRDGKIDECEKLILKYLDKFKEDFYVEVQINELTNKIDNTEFGQKTINEVMIGFADKYGIPIVLTSDTHYLNKEDSQIQTLSIALRNKETKSNISFQLEAKSLYYHKIKDFMSFNKEFGYNYSEDKIFEYCSNAYDISKKCDFLIPERKKMLLPYVYGNQENDDSELIKKARAGLKKRLNGEVTQEYKDRLNHELEILLRKGFSSYALILEDIFRHIKEKGMWSGVSRGCFTKDDNLITLIDNSQIPINEAKEGIKIITGFGNESYIDKVFEYDIDEDITEIETENGDKISSTQDHKILVIKRGLPKKIENAQFIEASKIEKGDVIIKNL